MHKFNKKFNIGATEFLLKLPPYVHPDGIAQVAGGDDTTA
jgi:hypothetical protein